MLRFVPRRHESSDLTLSLPHLTPPYLTPPKALKELLESGPVRCLRVLSFLRAVRPTLIYDAVKITDPYGPAIVDPELEAIVVSRETASGGAGEWEFGTAQPSADQDFHPRA